MTEFGEWLPDRPDIDNNLTRCEGVYHSSDGYRGFCSYNKKFQASAPPFSSLSVSGGFYANDGKHFYSGTINNILQHDYILQTSVIRTRASGYTTANPSHWDFDRFDDRIIAVADGIEPQIGFIGTTAAFSDLGGTPPIAKYVATVGDFVVLGNITDSGVKYPNRVQWSGFNDETSWTAGSNQSDFQDLKGSGDVLQVSGGVYGVIFTLDGIWRMDYAGLPRVFNFSHVIKGIKLISSKSVVNLGRIIYFLSDKGFAMLTDGSSIEYIGDGKIDEFFFKNSASVSFVTGAHDKRRGLVIWGYQQDAGLHRIDKLLVFNPQTMFWTYVDVTKTTDPSSPSKTLDFILGTDPAASRGLGSIFGLDGSSNNIGMFDTDDGFRSDVFLETGDIGGNAISIVKGVRPYIQINGATSAAIQVQIGKRDSIESTSNAVTWGATSTANNAGYFHTRSVGRFQRLRIIINRSNDSGDGKVDQLKGFDLDIINRGRR